MHAYNGLNDPTLGTSLHAHGLAFNGTNYYDGAVGVTQCSIPMNQTLSYAIDTSLQVCFFLYQGLHQRLTEDEHRRGHSGFMAIS